MKEGEIGYHVFHKLGKKNVKKKKMYPSTLRKTPIYCFDFCYKNLCIP